MDRGKTTVFEREHDFHRIKGNADFIRQVPVLNSETLYPYIQRILPGEKNILWRSRPFTPCTHAGKCLPP